MPTAAPRILILEDHPLQRHIFARLLSDAGFQVQIADGETHAAQLAGVQQPDVVVFDVHMDPEGTWRRLVEACGDALVVVTGHFTTEAVSQRIGAAAFVADGNYCGVVDAVRAVLGERGNASPEKRHAPYQAPVSQAELLRGAARAAIAHRRELSRRTTGADGTEQDA